jgi:hypothetical protein
MNMTALDELVDIYFAMADYDAGSNVSLATSHA